MALHEGSGISLEFPELQVLPKKFNNFHYDVVCAPPLPHTLPVYHVVTMLNPYAPPNDPTPIPQIDRRTRYFSIWLLATSAIAASTISAATLVAIHYLFDVARPLAAIGTIVIVIVIQFFTSVQVARQSKTNKIFVSQGINILSWSAFLGVLSGAHFLLPKVPELRWPDMAVFGSFAFASALLCLLTCHFVKLRVAEKNADS